jgi:hypothetical protein
MPYQRRHRKHHRHRATERASFIVGTAREEGAEFANYRTRRWPVIFAYAPPARTAKRLRTCESSFRRAIRRDLNAAPLLAAQPRGRA